MPAEDEGLPPESGPERTCIVTRRKGDPETMLRFVLDPAGAVVFDLHRRLPGRGAWLVAAAEVLATALKRKAFARAFKREVAADPGLGLRVEEALCRDAVQALALANKAGRLVCGTGKVLDALAGGGVAALVHAREASPDGSRKIEAAARRQRAFGAAPIPVVQLFDSPQMDLALGRSNVIHAALLIGGASDAFLKRAARLTGFRGEAPCEPVGAALDPLPTDTATDAGN